jgi:hypothetical protein
LQSSTPQPSTAQACCSHVFSLDLFRFLCLCKSTSGSFLWNHINSIREAPGHYLGIALSATVEEQLHLHREELLHFDTLNDLPFQYLDPKRREDMIATLSKRCSSYAPSLESIRSQELPKINPRILKNIDLNGFSAETVIGLFSASSIPNLEALKISLRMRKIQNNADDKEYRRNARRQIVESIAKSTGALTHLSIYVDKCARSMMADLKLVTSANPKLRVLDFESRFGEFNTKNFTPLLPKFVSSSDDISMISMETLWERSLPQRVQSCLGIPISHLRYNEYTVWQYYADFLLSSNVDLSTDVSSENADSSRMHNLDMIWNAVYPSEDAVAGGSPSVLPAFAFSAFFNATRRESYLKDYRTLNAQYKPIVEWIVAKAEGVFDSVDLQVVPIEQYVHSLFAIISFSALLSLDSATGPTDRGFAFASIHNPADPFYWLARHCLDEMESDPDLHMTKYVCDRVMDRLVERMVSSQLPALPQVSDKPSYEDDSRMGELILGMLLNTPQALLRIFDAGKELTDPKELLQAFLFVLDEIAKLEWSLLTLHSTDEESIKLIRFIMDYVRQNLPDEISSHRAQVHILESWVNDFDKPRFRASDCEALVRAEDLLDAEIKSYCVELLNEED